MQTEDEKHRLTVEHEEEQRELSNRLREEDEREVERLMEKAEEKKVRLLPHLPPCHHHIITPIASRSLR